MKIDNFLLALFQKISDWFQTCFGITNFSLARISTVLMVIFLLLQTLLALRMKWIGVGTAIVFIFLGLFFLVGSILKIRKTEVACKNNPIFTNHLAIEMKLPRLSNLLVNGVFVLLNSATTNYKDPVSFVVSILWLLLAVSVDCYFYFIACTPKPPSKSKVKKLVEKVSEMLSPTPRVSIA